jgi:hypothetical protein
MGVLRLIGAFMRTRALLVVWAIVGFNLGVHVLLRPEGWGPVSQVAGYGLLLLQLGSCISVQLTPMMSINDVRWVRWSARAEEGLEVAQQCPRTGALLPLRARYVQSAGGVVLGFDHFCFFLGTPIGLHNRKAFVLFLAYSSALCGFGAFLSWMELAFHVPRRQLQSPLTTLFATMSLPKAKAPALAYAWLTDLVERAAAIHGPIGQLYLAAVAATAIIDSAAAIALWLMTVEHLWNVLRNRMALELKDDRFDLGLARNLLQVFGPSLWCLPVTLKAAGTPDGFHWPTKANGAGKSATQKNE